MARRVLKKTKTKRVTKRKWVTKRKTKKTRVRKQKGGFGTTPWMIQAQNQVPIIADKALAAYRAAYNRK